MGDGWGKLVGYAAVALVTPYVILVSPWVAPCGYDSRRRVADECRRLLM